MGNKDTNSLAHTTYECKYHMPDILSSKRRVEGLLRALAEEGFDPEALDRIHAPIGLKINAQTPAEITVSICGEMIAHRRQYVRKDSRICVMPCSY